MKKIESVLVLFISLFSFTIAQQCYLRGEIVGTFYDGHAVYSYNECLAYCNNSTYCLCFTYNEMRDECIEFSYCEGLDITCSSCYSGERNCPVELLCNIDGLCNGRLVDYGLVASETECSSQCELNAACEFYAYREDDGTCALLEDCSEIQFCPTCHSGQKGCSISSTSKFHIMFIIIVQI